MKEPWPKTEGLNFPSKSIAVPLISIPPKCKQHWWCLHFLKKGCFSDAKTLLGSALVLDLLQHGAYSSQLWIITVCVALGVILISNSPIFTHRLRGVKDVFYYFHWHHLLIHCKVTRWGQEERKGSLSSSGTSEVREGFKPKQEEKTRFSYIHAVMLYGEEA